jgi:hypothetical protein
MPSIIKVDQIQSDTGNVAFTGNIAFPAGSASSPSIQPVGDTNTGIFFPAANTIAFAEGGVESMRINASGDVGIGTASPQARFQVDSLSATYGANIRARNNNFGNGVIGAASNILTLATDMNNMAFYTASNLGVDGTSVPTNERMRITSTGALCVGTTSATGTVRFIVESDTTTVNPMTVSNLRATAATDYSILFYRAGNIVGSVQTSLSATSFVTSSDYRLKENIAPMTGALAKVAQLKPVTYDWKVGGSSQGFIAHELQAVVPDCVTGEKDAVETYTDEDGNEQTRIKPQGVDTSFLVATLTAAIQELNAKVESQAAEIALLKV